MEDEDLVMPAMGATSTDDDLVMPSMALAQQKQPSLPKLPANMNPQQVKSFFSRAGKTLTDTQARDIAGMVSGKSYDEAMSLTSNYLAPKVVAPVQEQAPLVAAPQPGTGFTGEVEGVQVNTTQNQEPDFTFNTVGAEIARPKTASEVQENVAQTMIDGYKSKDKDLDYLFQLLDDGKLENIDLGPVGTFGLGELTKERKEKIKSDLLTIKSAQSTASKITNLATVKALQEESTKNIANLTNEVNSLQQDPMHDVKVLEKKKKELYDQVIINQVSNNTQKPFEEKQRLKSIADAQAAIDTLSYKQQAYITTKSATMSVADLGLTMLNSFGEFINKYSPEALTGRVMESYIEDETGIDFKAPITTAGGSALKEFSRIKKEEIEDYKKSNKTEYLAGQVSILDGLNAVNVGNAIGQTLGSMGAVIGGSLAGGPAGGIAVGYSLVYGDAVDAARKAGFNETESEIYGQLLAVGSGLLEELPVGKLLDGWTNTMLKRSVLNTIRTELKSGTPKSAIVKKILDQTLETTAKGIQQGIPEGITEVAQGGQEFLTQIAFNNYFKEKEDPGFELPTLKQFGKQSAEAFVLGFFGGGGASVVGDVMSGTQSYSKLASAAVKDNETFNNLNLVADGLLASGKITQQERDSFVGNLKIAQEAKAALPKYIKDDNVRQRSIELILEKKRLEADMATVDPSMQDGYKAKLMSIQAELKSISDQKWKAPANPVIFSSVSGLEAMTTSLVNNSSKENSAGTFVSTVESGKGFINDLIKSLDDEEPIAKPLIDRTVKSLETLAKSFAEAPVKTEMTQKAAQQAQELADQLKSYSYITESVEEKVIPGLDISLAADRIALGVPITDLDFMGDVPVDIQEAYQGIMSGDTVSSEDANNVQNVLYGKYKELSDIKQKVQDKLENTTSKDKQKKLSESINAISEIQANLSEDIGMIGRYRDETRINEESTGQVQETKTKPVVKEETKKEQAKPAQKLSEQELADMEYDYSNPSEAVTNMIDGQADASKIYKLLNGAIKFINKIAPNAKVYVHATSQEFYDALDSTTGTKNQRLADDGMYVGGSDGKPKAIHFNLESILGKKDPKKREEALRTFAHEAMHAGLQSIFGNDQKLFQSFQDKLGKVLESADLAFLNDFVELYKGEDYTSEEFLAELGGMMSAEGRKIPKPILARIAQLINNTITTAARTLKIPVDSNLLFKNTNDANDVIDFFNTMAESARTGITQEVQGKAEPLLKQQTKQANETEQPTGTRARAAEEQQKPAPAGNRLFNEPLAEAKGIADKYFESTFGRKKPNFTGTRFLDVENSKRISDAFIAMKHAPQDLEVARSYRQMIKETESQYNAIVDAGYSIVVNNTEPYNNSDQMINDLRKNKSVKIFSTESAFGDTPITEEQRRDNPLLARTKYKDANGVPLLANDLFRFVHDFFGHSELGNSFGAKGEENAWNVHARMYSPLARRAMTTETRGQNSYVNFSGTNEKVDKLREEVRKLREDGNEEAAIESAKELYELTKFADQKVGLLPEEFSQIDENDEGDRQEELGLPVSTTRARRTTPTEEDPAKIASEQMPMSAGNILYNDSEVLSKPSKKRKNAEVAIKFQESAANFWGGSIVTSETITPEQEKLITENGIQEAIDALEQDEVGNAANWYSTAIQTAIAVAGVIHTELVSRASAMKYEVFAKEKDPEGAARMALRMALAITSQNLNVDANTQYAEEQFDYFKKNGRFDSSKKYGAKAPAISSNLELANTIIEKMGLNAAEEFISNGFTVAALEVAFKEATGKKVKISGLRNDDVNGAAIFGPKIGQGFLQNLMGKFDPVTIDLWMRRTWGRWTGDVVGDGVTEDRMARLYTTVMQAIKNKELNITLPKEFKKHKPVQVKNEKGKLTLTMDDKFSFDRENNMEFVASLNAVADEIRLIADNHYKNIHYLPMTKDMYDKFLSGDISYVQASNKLKALNERQKEKYKVYVAAQKAKGLKALALNDKKVKDGETILGWLSTQNKKEGKIYIPTNEEISARKPEWGNAAKNIVTDLNPIDIPSNLDRRVITRVVNNIRKGLIERGYDVTNADVQAILWYPEKDIWAKMRGEEESNLKLSYDNQFIKIATERGLGEQAEAVAKDIRGGGTERTSTAPNKGPNEGVRGVANAEQKAGTINLSNGPVTRARRTQSVNIDPTIEKQRIETEGKIIRKDLFDGIGEFSSQLGGSDAAAVPVVYKEINGIDFVGFVHPETGSNDVVVTGKSENDFVGFYRIYDYGKPTNKWSSKFENQSRNKEDFKTMIAGIQEMLPAGYEYTEKTSISTDGLRVWNQQLSKGYELQYDENGKLKTNRVAINGDAIVNDLGIDVDKGNFENIKVNSEEKFEKVKEKLLPYLEKFGLGEENIHWLTGTVKIDLPILKKTETVTRARKTQSSQQYYNKARAADQGTKADRDNQAKIYDKAKVFLDSFYASGGVQDDEHEALYVYLSDNGIDIDPNDLFQLRFDIENGDRPDFSENKGGKGYAQPKGEETRKSRVLDRIKTKLEKLASDKSLNRKIVNKLKESLHYTVQNQDDAMRIAQMVVEEFGGIDGPQDVNDLFDLSKEFSGAVKTFIVGNVLNEAYKNAKKAVKGSEEQKRYQDIVNDASTLLAERARDNGREIAALYKMYLNSPEGMYTIEAKKFLQDVESAFTSKSQKAKIDALLKELKDAKDEAARLATEVASVKAAIATATGGPVAPTPPKPSAPKPPKPQTIPTTPTQANLKKERSLFQQLKDKLKSLGNTRARRQYPTGIDADVVDILAELARVNFERGIFDFYDIKDAIAKKLAKDNMSISDAHYTEMWNDIWREAGNAQNAFNAELLAKRIVFKTKQTAPSSAPMTDPIKLIKDELFKRATQDIENFDVDNETEFDKLRRLLFFYGSMTKPIWNESKDAVRRQIDALDPTKYSDAAKAELRRKLDNFFNDTIANALPRSEKKITATFAEDVKSKQLKIQEILLLPNETIATNREEFVADLVDRIVSGAGVSYSDAQAITEAFTKEYDALAKKTSEKVLARSVPRTKSKDKILKKSSAERAFEMIKYGAIDPNASLTDKDGNLTDLNDLFSDIFGLPKMNDEIRDNLKAFAEQIAKTKPGSIFRQQFYNDMISYIEFQKIRDSMTGSIILSQIYHNVLFSMDTMLKAFNSNVINMPHEFLTQALRAAAERDFSLIPLLAKSYFGRKGDKNTEVWFREGMNNAKLSLSGMVETENFNTTNTAEVLSKHSDSASLRAWGKYARKSNRFLGAIDTLFTSAATGARISDLLYDEIKYLAKQNGIDLSSKDIATAVSNIQGITNAPMTSAIAQATDEFKEAYGPGVDINSKKNIAIFRARVLEIIREGTRDRAAAYIVRNGWASELDGARIEEITSTAKELASKVGLVGNPPGTWGVLASMLKYPGKAMPGSQVLIGNMFANAPMNAAEKILQGNTLIGGIVLAIRFVKNQRGILNSNEKTAEYLNREGIRTEMYGRITSNIGGKIDINMEKKEMIVRYVMLQSVVIPLSIMSTTAIAGAIAKALDDDDERKEELLKNDIAGIGKIPENERHMLFFGDKTADVGTEEYNGQWKNLKIYVTGPMYGYTAPGAYSKMSAIKSMYGIEPYCVYSYGRLIVRYNDNPLAAAVFGSVGASNDVVLFNNNPEKPTETYFQQMMQSSFLQLNLVKDQAAIKPVMEIADAIGGKGAYGAPELENLGDRAKLLAAKKLGNLISNIVLPAEAKNFNQDMKSFMGMAAKDPREFYEFITFRAPIIELIINKDKTDSFNFPIEEKTKRVLPVGLQGLMYAKGPNGVFEFPQVDEIMKGPGGKYYAMFKKYNNDQFDKPGIPSYVERDLNNSGDSKIKNFTLDQRNQVRDEYKKIMREFCDKNYDQLKSGSSDDLFRGKLNTFLALYGGTTGYKDYIIKKVIGDNAFVNETVDEQVENAMDKIERKY